MDPMSLIAKYMHKNTTVNTKLNTTVNTAVNVNLDTKLDAKVNTALTPTVNANLDTILNTNLDAEANLSESDLKLLTKVLVYYENKPPYYWPIEKNLLTEEEKSRLRKLDDLLNIPVLTLFNGNYSGISLIRLLEYDPYCIPSNTEHNWFADEEFYKNCTVSTFDNLLLSELGEKITLDFKGKSVIEYLARRFVMYDRPDMLKHMHENGYASFIKNTVSTAGAAEYGSLGCLKYLHENGYEWNEHTTSNAADRGKLDCLMYAHENGCPWAKNTINMAAFRGHLDCVQYAIQNGCPWDNTTMKCAAIRGHLDCMICLHHHGVGWSPNVTEWADSLECLKYAHQNGCPWSYKTMIRAAEYNRLECLKYAHQNGCPWRYDVTYTAAQFGQLECLMYACENGCPIDLKKCLENSHKNCKDYLKQLAKARKA